MSIIGLFQCDPWCLPTQNWLKNATNDISIQEFRNVTRHYVKTLALTKELVYIQKFLPTVAWKFWI